MNSLHLLLSYPKTTHALSKNETTDYLVIQTPTSRIITKQEPAPPLLTLLKEGFKILRSKKNETIVTGLGDLEIVHFITLTTHDQHQRAYGNTTAGQLLLWKAEETILSLLELYGVHAFRRRSTSSAGGCYVQTIQGVQTIATITLSYAEHHKTVYARIVTLLHTNKNEHSEKDTTSIQTLTNTVHNPETIAKNIIDEYKKLYEYE